MNNRSNTHRLFDAMRRRAERFFGADLSSCSISISTMPQRLGTPAFAIDEHVFVSASLIGQSYTMLKEVLGHELVHVLQYQAGRDTGSLVKTRGDIRHYDLALEQQAYILGQCFASGIGRCKEQILPKFGNSSPIQTYITLAGQTVRAIDSLSQSAVTVLGFIKNGNEWFDWALKQGDQHYSFVNESQLIEGIQYGLHGNNLLFIPKPGLIVNPSRLLELSADDIKLLSNEITPQGDNTVADLNTSKMLANNQLRVKSDLDVGTEFLEQVKVAQSTIFQAMSLNDLIMLFDMVNEASSSVSLNTASQKEAAAYAVANAQSADEFIDLYEFYITLLGRLNNSPGNATKRSLLADQYLSEIGETLYGVTDAPIIGQGLQATELRSRIQNWVDSGKRVGFRSLTHGACQVMKETTIGKPGVSLNVNDAVADYLDAAQSFIKSNVATTVGLSQDGLMTDYKISNTSGSAALNINYMGILTLAEYQAAQ